MIYTSNRRKECNVCGGFFKEERGYKLEKRCPSCRFFNFKKDRSNKFTTNEHKIFDFFDEDIKSSEELLLIEEQKTIINSTLSKLPDIEREAVVLRDIEEYTFEGISKKFGMSVDRARTKYAGGIKMLKHPKVSRDLKEYITH